MTVAADRQFTLQFDGALTMTHHATNLDLPSEANITTAAGDVAVFQSTGSNTVQCINYTKADGTAVVAAAGGPVNNLLLNGGFTTASRGTSFTSASYFSNDDDSYLIDQWILLSDGNDIVDVTQQSQIFTGFSNAIRLDVETASKKFGILQILENKNCEALIGGTASLSFTAKVNDVSAGRLDNIKAAVVEWTSTSDSVTSDIISAWNAEDTTPTLAANWEFSNTPANLSVLTTEARYTIENISIDGSGTNNVGVFIWADGLTGTVTDTLDISGVQLESGSSANDYSHVDASVDVLRCGRYYAGDLISTGQLRAPGAAGGTTTVLATVGTTVPMRTTPSVVTGGSPSLTASDSGGVSVASSVNVTHIQGNVGASPTVSFTSRNHSGLTHDTIANLLIGGDGTVAFSAEL
jgi:hypothetical protein